VPACPDGARPTSFFSDKLEWLDKSGLATNVAVLLQSKSPLAWASLATELIDINRLCADNLDPPAAFTQDDLVKFSLSLSSGPLLVDTPVIRKAINWLRYQEFLRVCECLPPPPPSGGMCPYTNFGTTLASGASSPPVAYDIPQSIYDTWPGVQTPGFPWNPVYQFTWTNHAPATTQRFVQWSSDQAVWHSFFEFDNVVSSTTSCHLAPIAVQPPPMPRTGFVRVLNNTAGVSFTLAGFSFCFCGLAATPPPLPNQPDLPGIPDAPLRSCSDQQICDALNELSKRVDIISQLVTLIQRYHVPFAYVRGATHSAQTGRGSFQIPRSIGIDVEITAHTQTRPPLEGNPNYIWDQGWMSIMTGDGMIQEKRISQTNLIWQPPLMQEATVFGFELNPGTVANFTELYAEL
jgi:hypothetical protein